MTSTVIAPEQFYLLPGACRCAAAPTILTTVLGSCVAVCLWDGFNRIGGMNHFVLPSSLEGERSARFGDVANEALIEGMLGLGAALVHLRAKVFGGAAVLSADESGSSVGDQNVAAAFDYLGRRRIPVAAHRTGGRQGRLITLHTQSGEVDLRPVGARAAVEQGRR
jgi:chemotaxis protein CheD